MGDSFYEEAGYYRALFRERTHDLAFYRDVVSGADDVLELGIGHGRIALELARCGHRVVGVDASRDMLAELGRALDFAAPELRTNIAAIHADARDVRLDRTFERVLCPFNGLAHFHDDAAIAAVLATVRVHLAPDGLFAFDVTVPDPALLAGQTSHVPRLVHPRTGRVCRLEEATHFDAATKVLTITTTIVERETEETQVLTLALRQFTRDDLQSSLHARGLAIVRTEELGDVVGHVCRVDH